MQKREHTMYIVYDISTFKIILQTMNKPHVSIQLILCFSLNRERAARSLCKALKPLWLDFKNICVPCSLLNIQIFQHSCHCTDWYEIWALTDHEIYYLTIELDLRKFSNGPFSETKQGIGVGPTPRGNQCTGISPTLPWKWPRVTLSSSFGPFFERNHSFEVKMD